MAQVNDLLVTGQATILGNLKCQQLDEIMTKVNAAITVFSGDAAPSLASIPAEEGDVYLETGQ